MREPPITSRFSEDAFPLQALTGTVIASAFTVFREFGYGFLESVYRRALIVELRFRGVRVEEEVPHDLLHKGVLIGRYRADMIVDRRLIVEVKTGPFPDSTAPNQLLNYLCVANIRLGLVLDFGPGGAKAKRVIASERPAGERRRDIRSRGKSGS